MVELIDHTPLIHPVRSASELVKKAMKQNFIQIDLSEWRPRWVKPILKNIKNNKYGGLVVPEIHFAAFYTNTLLKSAGGYHELNGHLKALTTNTTSMAHCVKYHAALVDLMYSKEAKNPLSHAVESVVGLLAESLPQELIADTAEINVLYPYIEHKVLGKKAKGRVEYLNNLGKDEDWYCDMCAGPLCTHRSAMYLCNVLLKDIGLPTSSIAEIIYGFRGFVRHSGDPEKYETAVRSSTVLIDMLRCGGQSKRLEKEDMISLIFEAIAKQRQKILETGGERHINGTLTPTLDKPVYLEPQCGTVHFTKTWN